MESGEWSVLQLLAFIPLGIAPTLVRKLTRLPACDSPYRLWCISTMDAFLPGREYVLCVKSFHCSASGRRCIHVTSNYKLSADLACSHVPLASCAHSTDGHVFHARDESSGHPSSPPLSLRAPTP